MVHVKDPRVFKVYETDEYADVVKCSSNVVGSFVGQRWQYEVEGMAPMWGQLVRLFDAVSLL